MGYLSTVRVLDTDYKIKDEEAARINHTHKVEEIEGAAKEGHHHQASEIAGLSAVATSGSYSDLSGKPSAATESADGLMTSADKKKLDGIAAGASSYTHQTHTAYSSGLYKVAVDSLGHVESATAVTKADITALGIPAQDTNTTYGNVTENAAGLMSASDKKKLDGIQAGANAYSLPIASASTVGGVKVGHGLGIASDGKLNVGYMSGSTTTTSGSEGIVPAPSYGASNRYLRCDGTWAVPPDTNTTYGNATENASGLMSASDKKKLDGIASGAQVNSVSSVNGKTGAVSLSASDVGAASASHTHDISTLSGTAKSAAKLSTARTIAISGAVSGSATFDGSGNVNIATTANESYVSSPVSGLYNMAVDADGNLWVYHSDSDDVPNFEYDSATGNLYYVTEA